MFSLGEAKLRLYRKYRIMQALPNRSIYFFLRLDYYLRVDERSEDAYIGRDDYFQEKP